MKKFILFFALIIMAGAIMAQQQQADRMASYSRSARRSNRNRNSY